VLLKMGVWGEGGGGNNAVLNAATKFRVGV